MPKTAVVAARFPDRELAIRRLYAWSADFRAICDDYEEALSALRHWESAAPADPAKAEDYRRLATEIEAEIIAILDAGPSRVGKDGVARE